MSDRQILVGKLVKWGEVETVGAKGFRKRVIVVDDAGERAKWPNPVPLEVTGDRIDGIAAVPVGAEVEVDYYLRGREHGGRYYVSLNAVDVRAVGPVVNAGAGQGAGAGEGASVDPAAGGTVPSATAGAGADNLPF